MEVLQGTVRGFDLSFQTVQAAAEPGAWARVGQGRFTRRDDLYSEAEIGEFLNVPIDALVAECERLALHPNMDSFTGIDVASSRSDALFVGTGYRLRNGREVYRQRYYDGLLRRIPTSRLR